jgi:hypothetical protein
LRRLSPNSCMQVSVSDLYNPRIVQNIFGCSKINGPILEIYKYLIDTVYEFRNWETEHYNSVLKIRRLHSFISGNS